MRAGEQFDVLETKWRSDAPQSPVRRRLLFVIGPFLYPYADGFQITFAGGTDGSSASTVAQGSYVPI